MNRFVAGLLLLLLVLGSTGCDLKLGGSGKSQAPRDSAGASTATLPAIPLWPEPGLRLLDGKEDWSPGYTYESFQLEERPVQAIATPEGYFYVQLDGQAVYLVGTLTDRGGFKRIESPQLLYHLPLKPGDQWQYGSGGATFTVKGIEKVRTPAGDQLAARIEVKTNDKEKPLNQWWVPGYGLVQLERAHDPLWVAAKEVREKPQQAPGIGHPLPGMTALLGDNGSQWFVTDLATGQRLFQIDDTYWRSWYGWHSVGQFDLLTHSQFPGSWGIFMYDAHRFNVDTAKFELVSFISTKEDTKGVDGRGGWTKDGAFDLHDFLQYPARHYIYRWDGTAMRSDPATEQLEWADSPSDLAERLFNPPPLTRENFASAFVRPDEGRKLYDLLPSSLLSIGAHRESDPTDPDTFQIFDGFSNKDPAVVTVHVTAQNGHYYIGSYEWSGPTKAITGGLGEVDKEILGLRLETMKEPEAEAILGKPVQAMQKAGTTAYTRVYLDGTVTIDYNQKTQAIWMLTVTHSGKTPRGVSIGDTKETVLQRYGKPSVQSDKLLEYYDNGRAGGYYLRFWLNNGKVETIELHQSK